MSFQRGDMVRLNAGGPTMVVEQFEDKAGKIVRCKWFEGDARQEDTFYVDAICHYPSASIAVNN